MTPPVSDLVGPASLALSLAVPALVAARTRRARADREATARRFDALAARVERLEANAPTPEPAPDRADARPRRHEAPAGPTLISVPDLSAPAGAGSGASAEASAVLGRRYAAVWELADSGAPAEAIARATGHPVGQVELILGLRRQTPAAAGAGRPRPS